jgi:hypothetical protein
MEKDLREKLETTQDETARKELEMKLEKVLHKQQELAGLKMEYEKAQGAGPSGFSTDELKTMAQELNKKTTAVLAEYEKTTDESKKAELKDLLMKLKQKEESLKMEFAKAQGSGSSGFSTDEMKKMLTELAAKEADVREKLAGTTDPQKKAELEGFLKNLREKQEMVKMEFEKSQGSGSSGFSTDEMKKMLIELQAKEDDVRKTLEITTDPNEKAKLEDLLKKIRQKQENLKMEFERAKAEKIVK